ncbi:MAG: disulfide bond formation protein B [Betaproteobacteria bacterium]|nr:disulfide bond formation protein B [Betaproteobacteria bacterium]
MRIQFSVRAAFGGVAILCIGLLAVAYYAQHGPQHQQPCPFCILQRYAFLGIALVCAVAAVHGPGPRGTRWYAGLAACFALAGLTLASWLLLKGSTMKSCLGDPVALFVNGLPTAAWWDDFFWATGGCGDVYPPILGLTVPVWACVWFALFSGLFASISLNKFK